MTEAYPAFFVLAVVTAVAGIAWLLRLGGRPIVPSFSCDVCGRRDARGASRDWRYCPWCGAPRAAKGLQALPRG